MAAQISLPKEFEQRMMTQLGEDFNVFTKTLGDHCPVSIRLNPHKPSDHISGIPVAWSAMGRYLDMRPNFTLDPLFHAGTYYVQEASSMLLEQVVKQHTRKADPIVLDLSAAPGGKSTHLLTLLDGKGLLVANEVIRSRSNILEENISKWGHGNVVVTNNDPKDFGPLKGFFDVIVVDAPCSGEGLFRKDADAVQHWSTQNAELCSLRQQRILHDIWPSLKQDGVLIYSTCTYNPAENIENIKELRRHYRFDSLKLTLESDWGIETVESNGVVGYQCFPHKVKGEGFFVSILLKTDDHVSTRPRKRNGKNTPKKNVADTLKGWLSEPAHLTLLQINDSVIAQPAHLSDELTTLNEILRTLKSGVVLCSVKHEKIIPSHDLAMSIDFVANTFPQIELNHDEAIKYLRRDDFVYPEGSRGHNLIKHQGHALGWINHLGNRVNNLYPKEWRIRMQANPS